MAVENRILFVVQDRTGHSENIISWDPNDPKQVEAMKQMFFTMRKEGYMFFKIKKVLGVVKTKGEYISSFDEKLKEMIIEKQIKIESVQEENKGYERAEFFNPEKEEIEKETKYVATQPISGG